MALRGRRKSSTAGSTAHCRDGLGGPSYGHHLRQNLPRQSEQRLAFYDRAVVGECVKRLHEQTSAARFQIDVADRAHVHTSTRVKGVEHALAMTVLHQLALKRPEDFRIKRFELEAHLIGAPTTTLDRLGSLTLQTV